MLRSLGCLLLIALLPAQLAAQDLLITVVDAGHSPVPGAAVVIHSSDAPIWEGTSDQLGRAYVYLDPESSPTVTLNVGLPYPNPTRSAISVLLTVPEIGAVDVRLYDSLGRERLSSRLWLEAGAHRLEADLGGLGSGVFFLSVSSKQGRVTRAITSLAGFSGTALVHSSPVSSESGGRNLEVSISAAGFEAYRGPLPAVRPAEVTIALVEEGSGPVEPVDLPYLALRVGRGLRLVSHGSYANLAGDATLTQSFFVGETEVTNGLREAFLQSATTSRNDSLPMTGFFWQEGADLFDAMSRAEGLEECYADADRIAGESRELPYPYSCRGYRYLTDVEWEYAARAGSTEEFAWGADASQWPLYEATGLSSVATKNANRWGLFDVHANVAEYVHDGSTSWQVGTNPVVSDNGSRVHTVRGGDYWTPQVQNTLNRRRTESRRHNNLGARIARTGPNLDEPNRLPLRAFAPSVPSGAADMASGVPLVLSWRGADPDYDPLTFRAYFGDSPEPVEVAVQAEARLSTPPLEPGTTYYWRIDSDDGRGGVARGDEWSFSTAPSVVDTASAWQNSLAMRFQQLPPGSFVMGSEVGEANESPAHHVTLTRPFSLATHEMTEAQWWEVTGEPTPFSGGYGPAMGEELRAVAGTVSSALRAANMFSRREGLPHCYERASRGSAFVPIGNQYDCKGYRLPTEAEWEYAARAGFGTEYPFGESSANVAQYAWFRGNTEGGAAGFRRPPLDVGQLRPNRWGLYDMLGNVMEWTGSAGVYTTAPVVDPLYNSWIKRGGNAASSARELRVAWRSAVPAFEGTARLVRSRLEALGDAPEIVDVLRPRNGSQAVSDSTILEWRATDPLGELLQFDVYFGEAGAMTQVVEAWTRGSWSIAELEPATDYNWQVVARNSAGNSTEGPVWTFSTREQPVRATSGPPTPLGHPMRRVPPGLFDMGEDDWILDEGPKHQVVLTRPFDLSVNELTWADDFAIRGMPVPRGDRDQEGADFSRGDARDLLDRLSLDAGLEPCYGGVERTEDLYDCVGYRLPTEAEWEFALRGGSTTRYWFGNDPHEIAGRATPNSTGHIGLHEPSALGFHDMIGLRDEWTNDLYQSGLGDGGTRTDPTGPTEGSAWVVRGGSGSPVDMTSSARFRSRTRHGVRPARTASAPDAPNSPPHAPKKPSPADSALVLPPAVHLFWHATDSDHDAITYTVEMGTAPDALQPVAAGLSRADFEFAHLTSNRTWYWRVIATDERGLSTEGPVWHLRVADYGLPAANEGGIEVIEIPAGSFQMGPPDSLVQVSISRPFLIARTEVTRGLFEDVMGWVTGRFPDGEELDRAVWGISWLEAVEFANAFSDRNSLDRCYTDQGILVYDHPADCKGYRLPTEAEWEYAARAGTTLPFVAERHDRGLDQRAWFNANYNAAYTRRSEALGYNEWGIAAMQGNAAEWVADYYGAPPSEPVSDPVALVGTQRIVRGGYFGSEAEDLRVYLRPPRAGTDKTGAGIRLVRTK